MLFTLTNPELSALSRIFGEDPSENYSRVSITREDSLGNFYPDGFLVVRTWDFAEEPAAYMISETGSTSDITQYEKEGA